MSLTAMTSGRELHNDHGACFALMGFLGQTALVSTVILALAKHTYDSRVLLIFVRDGIENLSQSQPLNPLAHFLSRNSTALLDACKSTHFAVLVISALILLFVILGLTFLTALECKQNITKRRKDSTKNLVSSKKTSEKAMYFALGFTIGSTITTALFLLPFLLFQTKQPSKALTLGLRFYHLRDNPLVAVLGGIFEETLKHEPSFQVYASQMQAYLLSGVIISFTLLLLVTALLCSSDLKKGVTAGRYLEKSNPETSSSVDASLVPNGLHEISAPCLP